MENRLDTLIACPAFTQPLLVITVTGDVGATVLTTAVAALLQPLTSWAEMVKFAVPNVEPPT